MARKANPVAVRLGFNRDWESHWFVSKSADYVKYLHQDFKIRSLIFKELRHAGVASVEIFRDRGNVLVEIYTSRPGVVIGRGGEGTKRLIKVLQKELGGQRVDLAIKEVAEPYTWAKLVADQIAYQLEKRISHRRAMHQAIEEVMRSRRVKGIKIRVSGRLGGQEIARSELLYEGSVPTATIKADIDYALVESQTKYGKIGVKVWINRGEKRRFRVKVRKQTEF
ncbi:30S ribosomal protein S3 [bacterium]|nr:30S ribosomal protein S3 [bacterium]